MVKKTCYIGRLKVGYIVGPTWQWLPYERDFNFTLKREAYSQRPTHQKTCDMQWKKSSKVFGLSTPIKLFLNCQSLVILLSQTSHWFS